MVKDILLLGDPRLYDVCPPVDKAELESLKPVVQDMHDTLMAYKAKHNAGRAIAAPQIGVQRRLIYMFIDSPVVFINPVIEPIGTEKMLVMDDCMSFPELLVKVERFKKCRVKYLDMDWQEQVFEPEGDLSELLQHEYDHLDGILATMRAVDSRSYFLKSTL